MGDSSSLPEVILNGKKIAPGGDEAMTEVFEMVNMANQARAAKALTRMSKYFEDRASNGGAQS